MGPTLPIEEARGLLPDADIRGPVAVGDVLRLVDAPGLRRIAIIDGYFERMAAVWHKEILLALEAGIEVWGAASMGALRAAELAPFGMRGVGTIYERYARGDLVADDEVAVAHLPAEYGYRSTSVALVDLREGIELATAKRKRGAVHDALVELARARFYRERSWKQLRADATSASIAPDVLARLVEAPSRKAADARLLLQTMATTPFERPQKIRVPRTWALAQLRAWLAQ